jgi:hypothetical protein
LIFLNFRRPVPAVEEVREQVAFEVDVKFLRERQRRMNILKYFQKNSYVSLYIGKFHRYMKQGMSGEEALAKLNLSSNKTSNGEDEDEDDDDDDDQSCSDEDLKRKISSK